MGWSTVFSPAQRSNGKEALAYGMIDRVLTRTEK